MICIHPWSLVYHAMISTKLSNISRTWSTSDTKCSWCFGNFAIDRWPRRILGQGDCCSPFAWSLHISTLDIWPASIPVSSGQGPSRVRARKSRSSRKRSQSFCTGFSKGSTCRTCSRRWCWERWWGALTTTAFIYGFNHISCHQQSV